MILLLTLALGIVLILLIIAANGYFVAQEFAYMSADRNKLRALADQGDKSADNALAVTRKTSFMLSGAQLGITVTGLLVGYVAEPMVGQSLGELLGDTAIPAGIAITIGTVGTLIVATGVQMIFAELFPKNYAIANPIPLARGMATSTLAYLKIFGWLIAFFDKSANALLRLLRIEPVHDVESSATAKDLEYIVTSSHESGDLHDDMYLALDRFLDFPDHDVEHAMIPRSRTGYVHPRTTIAEVRAMMAVEHTRYPVISEDDEPIGVVHMIDILGEGHRDDAPVTEVMRAPVVVATLMPLPQAVEKLQADKTRMACVIDEYGGFTGVITIEDLAEEILGEITDEHDDEEPSGITPIEENLWQVDADTHLDEVERIIGHDIPPGDYETLSGLLISESGGLPEIDQTIHINLPTDPADYGEDVVFERSLHVTVLSVDRHVPRVVRVELTEQEPEKS